MSPGRIHPDLALFIIAKMDEAERLAGQEFLRRGRDAGSTRDFLLAVSMAHLAAACASSLAALGGSQVATREWMGAMLDPAMAAGVEDMRDILAGLREGRMTQ